MLISKKITLKPLLESTEGVHLTAYLVNRVWIMTTSIWNSLKIFKNTNYLKRGSYE